MVVKVQAQFSAGHSGQPKALPNCQISSAAPLPIPEDAALLSPRLTQLWDAEYITQQLFAVKLTQHAPQLSLLKHHEPCQLASSMAGTPAQQALQLLPQVIMVPRLSSRCIIEKLLSSSLSVALSLPESKDLAAVAAGLSFHDVVAPGQVLCDTHPTLPLVLTEDKPGTTAPALHRPVHVAQSLQAKPLSLAATELLLDWSLKNPAAPDPTKRLKKVRYAPPAIKP